jgi:hypothetical protein
MRRADGGKSTPFRRQRREGERLEALEELLDSGSQEREVGLKEVVM